MAVISKSLESVFLSIIKLWYLVASNIFGIPFKIPIFFEMILLVFPWTNSLAWIILDPNIWPIIWWPKQTPSIGIFLYSLLTMLIQFPDWLGLPGPGEITILSYFFSIFLLN